MVPGVAQHRCGTVGAVGESMKQKLAIARLNALGIPELREMWRQSGGRNSPPRLRCLVLRELAWRIQSAALCDIDAETRRLLQAAVGKARIGSSVPRRHGKRRSRPCLRATLPTGTKLVRTWRGRKHEVTVLDNGNRFSYRGESYESLTKIAEKITSAHWSGPRFFGVDRVRGAS